MKFHSIKIFTYKNIYAVHDYFKHAGGRDIFLLDWRQVMSYDVSFLNIRIVVNSVINLANKNLPRTALQIRGDQEGLFKLVTLDRILNRITGVNSGCWWLVVVNAIPILDICQINQQNISSCSVINNRIKKFL
jgi:hypothetical protein